jgi:hypothetical protein
VAINATHEVVLTVFTPLFIRKHNGTSNFKLNMSVSGVDRSCVGISLFPKLFGITETWVDMLASIHHG